MRKGNCKYDDRELLLAGLLSPGLAPLPCDIDVSSAIAFATDPGTLWTYLSSIFVPHACVVSVVRQPLRIAQRLTQTQVPLTKECSADPLLPMIDVGSPEITPLIEEIPTKGLLAVNEESFADGPSNIVYAFLPLLTF